MFKKNKYENKKNNNRSRSINYNIPTLNELEQCGQYVPKKEFMNMDNYSLNQQHSENSKRELLFKFDMLRKKYSTTNIPEFTIHSDLNIMEQSYNDTLRRISLDSSVENYKKFLIYGFMGCEFVFGNFLGFDMKGFTQQQLTSMNSYDSLLIELGEKNYVPTGSNWSVEVRLLGLILMNAAVFVVSKIIFKKTGTDMLGMINSMNNKVNVDVPKPKMKGPNIDLDNL
jgi:hypothetical protein